MVVGLSILLANLTSGLKGGTLSTNLNIPANGTYTFLTYLSNRPYEFRILVPKDFNGTVYIFNYGGINRLVEGIREPLMERSITGSQLIDFTPKRRGAYMIIIESQVSRPAGGSLNLIEKEAISQDVQGDSSIIVFSGLLFALASKVSKFK